MSKLLPLPINFRKDLPSFQKPEIKEFKYEDYNEVAINEVYVAVALRACIRSPQNPEAKETSVTVVVQLAGSLAEVTQTLAESVVPTT